MPGTPPPLLNEQQAQSALQHLHGWRIAGAAFEKTFVFQDFSAAFAFMTRVALLSESQGHHPDWCNVWNKVTIRLSTHESGGLTLRDSTLAAAVDQLLQS